MSIRSPLTSPMLLRYAENQPSHAALTEKFDEFLRQGGDIFDRRHHYGHLTGSAWLVSGDGERVLLTHHRKLDRWLQLGCHAAGDVDLARVALREAAEESGLSELMIEPEIFDLDRHRIPTRAEEPAHWHYDVRYVVCATGSEAFAINVESLALAWRSIRDIAGDVNADESLGRMARRWLDRQ